MHCPQGRSIQAVSEQAGNYKVHFQKKGLSWETEKTLKGKQLQAFVDEDLTRLNAQRLADLKKDIGVLSAWTFEGSLHCKMLNLEVIKIENWGLIDSVDPHTNQRTTFSAQTEVWWRLQGGARCGVIHHRQTCTVGARQRQTTRLQQDQTRLPDVTLGIFFGSGSTISLGSGESGTASQSQWLQS